MLCISMSSLMFIRHQVANDMQTRNGTMVIMAQSLFAEKKITHFQTWIIGNYFTELESSDICLAGLHLREAEACEHIF